MRTQPPTPKNLRSPAFTMTTQAITLRGSAEIVAEFFDFAVNSILYQRGIYPAEEFEQTKHYGTALFIARDHALRSYLNQVVSQMKHWLVQCECKKFVVLICDAATSEPKERWTFDVETDTELAQTGSDKDPAIVVAEIRNLIRQITSCVSFLPLLECPCTFDLLVYTNKDATTPQKWEESAPHYIANSEEVRLRSFTTKVDSLVSYKVQC